MRVSRAIVLLAHGSRDPRWREPIEAVARRIEARAPGVAVRCAYLELTAPDLSTVARQLVGLGTTQLRVLPMFLGMGRHAREDLPRLVQSLRQAHPQLVVDLQPAVGENAALIELLADLALHNLDPANNS